MPPQATVTPILLPYRLSRRAENHRLPAIPLHSAVSPRQQSQRTIGTRWARFGK